MILCHHKCMINNHLWISILFLCFYHMTHMALSTISLKKGSLWGPYMSKWYTGWKKTCTLLEMQMALQNRCQLKLKPWPNRVANKLKFKFWVYLWLRLARPCLHLLWLVMTCAHFGWNQICMQLDTSFSPFGHLTQVNASWVMSIDLFLAHEIQHMSALKCFFCNLCVLARKLACLFGHQMQVSMLV